jgi:hypothetical protein
MKVYGMLDDVTDLDSMDWWCNIPLIFFHMVELHLLIRVLR